VFYNKDKSGGLKLLLGQGKKKSNACNKPKSDWSVLLVSLFSREGGLTVGEKEVLYPANIYLLEWPLTTIRGGGEKDRLVGAVPRLTQFQTKKAKIRSYIIIEGGSKGK